MFRREELRDIQTAETIAWAVFALLFTALLYLLLIHGNIGDKNIWLVNAHMLLRGKVLYRDIFAVSPPLIYYLYVPPVYVAEHIGVPDYVVSNAAGLAIITAVAGMATRLVARHPAFASPAMQRQHFLLLLFVFTTCSGAYYFFDREQIFLVLTFPYVLRFMPSLAQQRISLGMRFAIGAMAAIGLCIKPHCFILPAAVALLTWLWNRSLAIFYSIENITVYILTAIYAAYIYRYAPEYVHIVLPMALATYDTVGSRAGGTYFLILCLLIFAITFDKFSWREKSPYRRDIFYLLGTCLGFLVYALLGNGWGYTYNPLGCGILVATGWVWWEHLYFRRENIEKELPVEPIDRGIRNCALNLLGNAVCITLGTLITVATHCQDFERCDQKGLGLLQSMSHARSFGTISTEFGIWGRLVNETGARWDTRFSQIWMLPKFFVAGTTFKEKNRWIVEYVANALADDLNAHRPDVVFVDNADSFYALRVRMDLVGLLNEYPRFRDAWEHYHFARYVCQSSKNEAGTPGGRPETYCLYSVYARTP